MTVSLRHRIDADTYADPSGRLKRMIAETPLTPKDRAEICRAAETLVRDIRDAASPGLMEVFLAEYGLSTNEGVALMCLAEALLRVPDAVTMDALIEDKIAPANWGRHLGQSASSLVNASTWALMLTGRVLEESDPGTVGHLRAAIKRLGEPVIRSAVARAMKEMGRQFVLGEDIGAAMQRASHMERKGYTYSYDMLGEAARTKADAERYNDSYTNAIDAIAASCGAEDIRENPGISVKLSALHPRYEVAQRPSVIPELVPRLRALALRAKSAHIGLNVDAEEADRLALSLEVINQVMAEPALGGWDGFGVVVQAYSPRAGTVIDALYDMAVTHERKIMVRLVKGAYWDTEIKRAQVAGLSRFPVFVQKPATDVAYICNARKLLTMTDRIYPQFATHNAHTVAAILHMAEDGIPFEFQRLHGMGEALHELVRTRRDTHCRIYAPVGAHQDLLAYLVRRLLENGANSSFVNQIVDASVPPSQVAADPFDTLARAPHSNLPTGPTLFFPRKNAIGFDLAHTQTLDAIETARSPFRTHTWHAAPRLARGATPSAQSHKVEDPTGVAAPGEVTWASQADVAMAFAQAVPWDAKAAERRRVLERAATSFEDNHGEIFALLAREAGKSLPDCVAELREAVDFLRYYAAQATDAAPAGAFVCISPWNFPLAIFTGQVAAALAAGNAVLAKPAEQTPLIAEVAVALLHKAGVPATALQALPGGAETGTCLSRHPDLGGLAFTGSTETALKIRRAMADHAAPGTPFIAETGGINAMIVDSTALPEQAVEAVIESAFQSAGQRCSALRCLYVQEEIAESFTEMLIGAMHCLRVGTPWALQTDIGPVIDAAAHRGISEHIEKARSEHRVLAELDAPTVGHFIGPTLIAVRGIADVQCEVFGPVLHLATFKATELDAVVDAINDMGYGLTCGLQTRIDARVQSVSDRIKAGNFYVNRNQIGAIVGSQPFGGEGLSGTGPKAGGPYYLKRFAAVDQVLASASDWTDRAELPQVPQIEEPTRKTETLPGPTGESNRLSTLPRPALLCAGPGTVAAAQQAKAVETLGGIPVQAQGMINPADLAHGPAYGGVLWWGDTETARAMELALAARRGAIVPLITGQPDISHVCIERHVCVDTTAAGGNAALLSAAS